MRQTGRRLCNLPIVTSNYRELNAVRRQFWQIGLLLALGMGVPVDAAESFASAYISEFMASNTRGLSDDDGERSGWIEIHNGGTATINLNGWFLTDNATNLTRWRFPGVALLPDKYLVVFASAKNRTNDPAHLHTNFRLNSKGGYLALVGLATNVVSEFSPKYPKQSVDVSYGRVRGEPAIHGPMPRPTPGRPNPANGSGFAPQVVFSRAGGGFTDPFGVQLSSPASRTVIRYTLDGSLPTVRSAVYSAPLLITNTTYVRARTFQDGLLPGPPHGEAYLKLSTNMIGFTSTLPVLVMDTFGNNVPTSTHGSFVYLSFFEPNATRKPRSSNSRLGDSRPIPRAALPHAGLKEGANGQAGNLQKTSLTNPPTLTTRAGFHVRGSTSSGFRQSPFAVQFVDEFNEEQHLSLAGLPAESDWVLYAPNDYDLAMIHNPLVYQLSRDMGRYSPRTRFVEVFVGETFITMGSTCSQKKSRSAGTG